MTVAGTLPLAVQRWVQSQRKTTPGAIAGMAVGAELDLLCDELLVAPGRGGAEWLGHS
jgi:hypothetical protein